MTIHHLFTEEDFLRQCPYCRRELTKANSFNWSSKFEGEIHYKFFNCDCGNELKIKVSFHGSGHDSWNKKKKQRTIDDKIKEVEGIKEIKK